MAVNVTVDRLRRGDVGRLRRGRGPAAPGDVDAAAPRIGGPPSAEVAEGVHGHDIRRRRFTSTTSRPRRVHRHLIRRRRSTATSRAEGASTVTSHAPRPCPSSAKPCRRVIPCWAMPNDAELRKAARANASVRIFRQGEQEAEADADAAFWDSIPLDERAEFVWKLSLELHAIAHPDKPYEPRLSRSFARVVGR